MKIRFNLISRASVIAFATSAICISGSALAADPSPSPMGKVGAMMDKKSDMKMKSDMKLDSKDKNFMMEAAKGGMREVDAGKMAIEKGQSAAVKKIGKTMVSDHMKANDQLMALAKKKGVMIDSTHKLAKMDEKDFDKSYLEQMVKDHEKTIALFESEAKDGKDADVKSWASKTLPTLKKHLKMVQDAQAGMKKA